MRLFSSTSAFLLTLGLVACGTDSKTGASQNGNTPTTTETTQSPNGTTTTQTQGDTAMSNEALNTKSSSSKMVVQSTSSVDEQSDFSESATTGTDDDSGIDDQPKMPSANFGFSTAGSVGFTGTPDAPDAAFRAAMNFRGNKHGNSSLDGNVLAQVSPAPMPMHGPAADTNLSMTLTFDVNRTLKNGDVIVVQTEPNITITKSGRRGKDAVTRTITGTVHRSLTSAKDANANFDLTITHAGTTVVDSYARGKLGVRTTNGATTVVNNLTKETAVITYKDLQRGKPGSCLCPTGGSVQMVVTAQDGTVTDHTYGFAGACGTASVDVTAGAKAQAQAAGNANGIAGASVSSSAHVKGEMTWEDCAVVTN